MRVGLRMRQSKTLFSRTVYDLWNWGCMACVWMCGWRRSKQSSTRLPDCGEHRHAQKDGDHDHCKRTKPARSFDQQIIIIVDQANAWKRTFHGFRSMLLVKTEWVKLCSHE